MSTYSESRMIPWVNISLSEFDKLTSKVEPFFCWAEKILMSSHKVSTFVLRFIFMIPGVLLLTLSKSGKLTSYFQPFFGKDDISP